ncbi:deoxyhypusine synthase, partial [Tanacetum coccineum]
NVLWTPSKVIARLGKEINDESSYLYWAYKNDIPVFYPGLTDGSLGDMLHIHSFRDIGLVVDVVQDYAVFINIAQEFDGSDSGASPDEAVSWGKIRASAKSVKVHCDATIAFPLLVAETFAAKREKPAEPRS